MYLILIRNFNTKAISSKFSAFLVSQSGDYLQEI